MFSSASSLARTPLRPANAAIAASSAAPVAFGYERSLRPCADTVFGRLVARSMNEEPHV
jgi:hypothetical protein